MGVLKIVKFGHRRKKILYLYSFSFEIITNAALILFFTVTGLSCYL